MNNEQDNIQDQIWQIVKNKEKFLLHCHPHPDPDSIGSALATKYALESLGKSVTLISGDSPIPKGMQSLPGVGTIISKNFSDIDLSDFDVFISLDSAQPSLVSTLKPPVFPLPITTIVIDHHDSNTRYGEINLVDSSAIATSEILFEIFEKWNVKINKEIALNLLMGIWSDSGGFQYPKTTSRTFAIAEKLSAIVPDYHKTIYEINNQNRPNDIYLTAKLLNNIQVYLDGKMAIATVTNREIEALGIDPDQAQAYLATQIIRSVPDWYITVTLIEIRPKEVKASFRTRDVTGKIDVSKLSESIGGGGHKGAAGARAFMSLDEVKEIIINKAREILTVL